MNIHPLHEIKGRRNIQLRPEFKEEIKKYDQDKLDIINNQVQDNLKVLDERKRKLSKDLNLDELEKAKKTALEIVEQQEREDLDLDELEKIKRQSQFIHRNRHNDDDDLDAEDLKMRTTKYGDNVVDISSLINDGKIPFFLKDTNPGIQYRELREFDNNCLENRGKLQWLKNKERYRCRCCSGSNRDSFYMDKKGDWKRGGKKSKNKTSKKSKK